MGSFANLTTHANLVELEGDSGPRPSNEHHAEQEEGLINLMLVDLQKLRKKAAMGNLEPGIDHSIVWWDGDNDPENPFNWPSRRKILNVGLISALTFLTTMASSIFAPGVPALMQEFGSTNNELATFVVSVYVLGFAFGPMVIAPLSEIYGRSIVYQICNICLTLFLIACALAPNLDSLIFFCFMAGTFGACPLTNGGGSIADMMAQEKRAVALAAFAMGPMFGPVIGPIVGGALSDTQGWRWSFGVVAIISAALSTVMLFTLDETYAPTILDRKVQRLRKETGLCQFRSRLDTGLKPGALFKLNIVRPAKLLVLSPICTIFALFLAVVYGILYLLFSSVPFVFQLSYGFSAQNVGLAYLGLGVGSIIAMVWFGWDSSREVRNNKEAGSGEAKPEVRLKLLPYGTVLMPVGLFIYGWTAYYKTHWMGPIFALAIVGFGNIICFMSVSMYLVDAYHRYAASALAANTVVRSIAGAVLPLCALKMYDVLGLGWGNSLLGFIGVAIVPVPFFVMKYGEKLRIDYGPKIL